LQQAGTSVIAIRRSERSVSSQAVPSLPRVPQFPSLKSKKLLRVLKAEPLEYRIVRQRGSHRKMEAANRPTIIFSFHDSQTIRPSTVKDILCNQVGLAEQEALALL
jgi:predicted RNA binding protein YcfA (HicA-like mRNA interferase family)